MTSTPPSDRSEADAPSDSHPGDASGAAAPVVVDWPVTGIAEATGGGGAGSGSDPFLAGLNPQQREAVEYRGKALLIVAGAGSGKTRVLTHRIARLIHNREAWPSQILAITFTNKAASEMRERVEDLLGDRTEGMWISTFHSACVRILRREAENVGFGKNFTIYDSADSRVLLKRIIKQHDADVLGFTPANASARISKLKNELADAESFARNANMSDPNEVAFVEIFADYQRELRRASAFDFDDLISQTVFLFRAFPQVAALYRRKFRHVLVDEYQDTNHAQYALIRELVRAPGEGEVFTAEHEGASLTVVGDSDQSIYAFRGADIRNIVEFERDFPGSKVILLEQNYRSTQNILSAANAVIANNFDRKEKRLWTDLGDGQKIIGYTGYSGHDEAQFIADEIEKLRDEGVGYNDIAVFYRTNAQTRALEEIFVRSALPYRIMGGTKFYERAEIKDAFAYLTAVMNPADELAVRRIVNTPKRGVGQASVAQLATFAENAEITLRDALRDPSALGFGPKLSKAVSHLSEVLDEASALADQGKVAEVLETLLSRSGLMDSFRLSKDPQDEARAENLDELLAVTKEFERNNPDGTLVDFLTEVSLVAAADDIDDASGTVSLMTLHTAKGLEYDTVFLTGVEEDLLPHRMSANEPGGPSEERRLFYVGITRARRRLFLTLAMTRAQYGETNVALPSRYLQEIPGELIEWRQSPASVNSRGGTQSRALNARRGFGGSGRGAPGALPRDEKKEWPNKVTNAVRDNGDLELAPGDRVRHTDFGEGRVNNVTGSGTKKVAHVQFDAAGSKKLLIKIAPIEKL